MAAVLGRFQVLVRGVRGVRMASSTTGFFQESFKLGNQFDEDPIIAPVLKRHFSKDDFANVSVELHRLGDTLDEYGHLGDDAEAHPPRVEHFDLFGRRVDRLITSHGWQKMHDVSAVEGLVAIAYERKYGHLSRLYQIAKVMLWSPVTATYGCPLAMTDGAARLIELSDDAYLKREVFPHLITRDPKRFWTSGQWMTERPGGSDVSRTETEAVRNADGSYAITGFKWFSSATDANMTLLLARTRDANNRVTEGSKGLSLFFAKVRNDKDELNGVRIQRLKNKYGTKALPTAELELDNMTARMVGKEGRGVATISTILNVTRFWAALTCAAAMRRALAIIRDYATRREVFGQQLSKQPLHVATLAGLELETRAAQLFAFDVALLLGKNECGQASKNDEVVLRLLTPIVKLYVSKQSVAVLSEAMEALGGQGYIEDTGLARILRDAQVNAIWEGTTNVLSLDVLRVFSVSAQAFDLFTQRVESLIALSPPTVTSPIREALKQLREHISKTSSLSRETMEASARQLAFALARTYCAALFADHAHYTKAEEDEVALRRWVELLQPKPLGLSIRDEQSQRDDFVLVFGKAKL